MAGKQHIYRLTVEWAGNRGAGTSTYAGYSRDHIIAAGSKPTIAGSADPAFLGDPARWSPEDLLLASIAACHKLWYLHLCATAGITILAYQDAAEATMAEEANGSGRFTSAVLRPNVAIQTGDDVAKATRLHHKAHEYCFIANSLNFPVTVQPVVATG